MSAENVLIDFGAPVQVGVLTPLLAFERFNSNVAGLLFVLVNLDPANEVQFIVDTSEDGTHVEAALTAQIPVAAGLQGSVEAQGALPGGALRSYWRLSAQCTDVTKTANVKWRVNGVRAVR